MEQGLVDLKEEFGKNLAKISLDIVLDLLHIFLHAPKPFLDSFDTLALSL